MKKFATITTLATATLVLSACGDGSEEAATTAPDSAAGTTETIIVDDTEPMTVPADEGGTTLNIGDDGASMTVDQPGVDANVQSDGDVDAEVRM